MHTCSSLLERSSTDGFAEAFGWLSLLSSKMFDGPRRWTKRWATLRGATLCIFDSPDSFAERERYQLTGAVIGADPADASVLLLRWPDADSTQYELELQAPDAAARDAWGATMKTALRFDRFTSGSRPGGTARLGMLGGGEDTAHSQVSEAEAREKASAFDAAIPASLRAPIVLSQTCDFALHLQMKEEVVGGARGGALGTLSQLPLAVPSPASATMNNTSQRQSPFGQSTFGQTSFGPRPRVGVGGGVPAPAAAAAAAAAKAAASPSLFWPSGRAYPRPPPPPSRLQQISRLMLPPRLV